METIHQPLDAVGLNLLLFFLHGVTEQSKDAVIRAKQLQDLQLKWRQQLTQARASALLLGQLVVVEAIARLWWSWIGKVRSRCLD